MINPVVVHPEGDIEPDENPEGCLSVPGLASVLARPSLASVTGQDLNGEPIRVDGTGVLARCLQHETDHLNGLLYVDRLPEETREGLLAELAQLVEDGDLPEWSAGPAK